MANRTENVGIFTAYGFAREGGYVGTKAEFEEGLAKSANYATNAQASATAAANSATSASTMATAAASSAGAAAGSANTAAGYAQDADEFAQAAAASADEAEGYAESIDPDQFAKIDGYYGTLKSGESDTADNLTPYSSDSGTSQNTPFILQGSGCANGEEQADTGSYCQLQRKNGNTVTVNQLVRNPTFVDTSIWSGQKTTFTVENNVARVVCGEEITASMGIYQNILEGYQIPSHKYLLLFTVKPSVATKISAYYAGAYFPIVDVAANTKYWYSAIITLPQSPQGRALILYINYGGTSMVEGDYADISNVSLIDLTLWFGSNDKIPTHLLNHPEDFFRYYQGDLSYNVGALTDSNGRYLKTKGRNIFDGVSESGYYDPTTGEPMASNNFSRSKNEIRVSPNTTCAIYYAGTGSGYALLYDVQGNYTGIYVALNRQVINLIPVPANACVLKFYLSNAAFDDIVTVSLYYLGESGYDKSYPYEELANIDTGDEPLLAFDYKTPDGTIHHDTLPKIDMGSLTWGYYTATSIVAPYFFAEISDALLPTNVGFSVPSIKCSKYIAAKRSADTFVSGCITLDNYSGTAQIQVKDSAYTDAATFKTAMSGVMVELLAKTPTTEQGTPFPENVAIDDFGTMAFDCPNGVPQGNLIFYPVDYKAEFDTLHNITEGDMHKIALKGDLAEGEPETIEEVIDYINARIPAPPAEDGTYNLTVTVASGEATYSWVSAT